MNRQLARLALALFVALIGACASIPESTIAVDKYDQLTCPQLAQEVIKAQQTATYASQVKSESWKVVVPFAIAARYADGAEAGRDAQLRLTTAKQMQTSKSCPTA